MSKGNRRQRAAVTIGTLSSLECNFFVCKFEYRPHKNPFSRFSQVSPGRQKGGKPSLRTSNPIESTFGTIRHRTKRSKGCLSRDGMLHMMFKLGLCAEKKWRRLRGFDYLAKVVTGIKFKDGVEVTGVDLVAA